MVSTPPPRIRRASPSDLPAVLSLLHAYYTTFRIQQRDDEAATAASLADPRLGYLLATLDGTPLGCVLLKALPAIPLTAECKRLFVLPEARGHHLGDLLMDAAEDLVRAAGLHHLYLDTNPTFAAAVALYERRGYLPCPRYNTNPQATIFLRKRLS